MRVDKLIEDLELSLELLRKCEVENDIAMVRLQWLTCLTLLRAAGHVHNSEVQNTNKKQIANKLFNDKRNDKVYSEFIKKERDLLLKEYEYYVSNEHSIRFDPIYLVTEDGFNLLTEDGNKLILEQDEKVLSNFKKNDGYKKDLPPSELVREAIDWWKAYFKEFNELCGS
ncbi:hypothetical protein [Psychroflexus sp. MES1-P1E]|uniref:hypothetical protein n=1 Tax=Psychroflexus sp. MES1-P1E TaxID=2058320 RepID=UPI000C7B62BD|nr:hypothetical protein [Psychroflexus sp. MES1-P1E]PKG42572.1 hypothetical protein CXF67_09540 [Psychroflexus sp. MES1-P1E]